MKKLIAFILTLVCLLSCAVPALAAEKSGFQNFKKTAKYTDGIFSDVKETDWYRESVAAAYELGLMQGGGDGTFNAAGNVTIAETLVLADKLHSIFNTGSAKFTTGEPWYQTYVDYALKNGIMDAGMKNYDAAVTRGEFIRLFYNALPEKEYVGINLIMDGAIPDVATDAPLAKQVYTF